LIAEGLLYDPETISLCVQKFDFESENIIDWDHEVKLRSTSIVATFDTIQGEQLVLRPLVLNCPCGYVA
jgi:hypothetical protein